MTASIDETIRRGPIAETLPEDYFTYVAGVGNIPRDIYKHVKSNPFGDLPRYSAHIVLQHFLIFTTFITLAATGIPLHYADLFWAPYVISIFGGIDTAQLIHRSAAFVMIGACVYHLLTIVGSTIRKIIKKEFDIRRTQVPLPKDLFDLIHDVKYFLGIRAVPPQDGKIHVQAEASLSGHPVGEFRADIRRHGLVVPGIYRGAVAVRPVVHPGPGQDHACR